MEERKPPSFGYVFGVVWKVLMAILLIPSLALLGYIGYEVIGPDILRSIGFGVLLVAMLAVMVYLSR